MSFVIVFGLIVNPRAYGRLTVCLLQENQTAGKEFGYN
jgi:hypothetical protein